MGMLNGKKAVVFGVANDKSIAWGIAKKLRAEGCEVALTYAGEIMEKRVLPLAEELGAAFTVPCDVTDDAQIDACFAVIKEKFGTFDYLIHSVAFAPAEALKDRYVQTARSAFATAMDISAYSLVGLCRAAEPMMNEGGSVITMSYYGAVKVVQNYNVMGVAKAALEASVRYLAVDLGAKKIKVNAISAGPIKTLAASGISGFKSILSKIEERAPLGQNVTQEDVAGSALYLCSELSGGVTGQVIYVDAGYNILGL